MNKKEVILVTGGAGYIGSHTVRALVALNKNVLVLDNLVYGHRDAIVDEGVSLIEGDIADASLLDEIFTNHTVTAVVHFAAYAYVGESVTDPIKYYDNNTAKPLVLLSAMQKYGCKNFVFSSTCATYGDVETVPIVETTPQSPINPYGWSKYMLEIILKDCDRAWGLKSVCLRYFNASGCDSEGLIGEDHNPETHLIPLVLMAIKGERDNITVFGTDYPTPDGTCIRDYIHVEDLADAHAKALQYLAKGGASTQVNLGTGVGVSVKQIIDAAEKVSGQTVPAKMGERRAGDPAELIANASKAKEVLGWEAQHKDATKMVESAWQWMNQPHGGRFPS